MSAYKELDIEIKEYVGYLEDVGKHGEIIEVCADPVLYDNITNECTRHLNGNMPLEMMSKDAQYCITEWESKMKVFQSYNERKEHG